MAEDINVVVRMSLAEDLAEEVREQFQQLQQIINGSQLNLTFKDSGAFLKEMRETFDFALQTAKAIRKEFDNGLEVKIASVDQAFITSLTSKLETAFEEAMSRVIPDAKKLANAFGGEVERRLDKAVQRAAKSAKSGSGRLPAPSDDSELNKALSGTKGSTIDDKKVGEELDERYQDVLQRLRARRSEFTNTISGLAVTLEEGADKTRKGIKGISNAFSLLSSRQAKNTGKVLRPVVDDLLKIVEQYEQLSTRYKSINTGKAFKIDSLPADLKLIIDQSEDLLRLTRQWGNAADDQLRLYERRLRDTAQTTKFLEESTLKFAEAIRRGDSDELEAINIQHRSLGQKLAREVISLTEQEQRLGSIVELNEKLADEARTRLQAQNLSGGERAEIEGLLQTYQRITKDALQRIDILKEEGQLARAQRQQVESITKRNRANIRIIEEQRRLNEKALRQAIQIRNAVDLQRRSFQGVLFSLQEIQRLGGVLSPEQAARAKSEYAALNQLLQRAQQNLQGVKKEGRDALDDLRRLAAERTGQFANLGGDDAVNEALRKALREQKDINDDRQDEARTAINNLRKTLQSAQGFGIDQALSDSDQVQKATKDVDKLGLSFTVLKERIQGLGRASTSGGLEDLQLNIRAVQTQQNGYVRDLDQLIAKLNELAQRGLITEKQFKADTAALRALRAEIRGLTSIGSPFAALQQQAGSADFTKFLSQGLGDAQLRFERLNQQIRISRELFDSGLPAGILAANSGFKRASAELQRLEKELADVILLERQAADGGLRLEKAERAAASATRQLAVDVSNLKNDLARAQLLMNDTSKSAQRAGLGFRLYNKELASSIVNNAKFINSMTILTSALFLLRRGFFDVIEESKAYARALTVAQSATADFAAIARELRTEVRQAAVEFGVPITEALEVFKQFGSAGLEAEEGLAALRDTLRVIISTSADAEEVTRAVAGIYNVFGDELSDTGNKLDSFGKIADTLTSVYRNHQAELDEVVQGMRFASATGRAAGFQFNEISAFLAVLNDNLIKSGAAGRGLQVVFAQLARKAPQLADSLGVAIDPTQPLNQQFLGFLEEINTRLGAGTITVEELSKQFQTFGLRGARSAVTLIQNFDQVTEALDELENAEGTAAALADIVQNELANSFERAKQILLELVRDTVDPLQRLLVIFSNLIQQFRDGVNSIPGGNLFGTLIIGAGGVVAAFQSLLAIFRVVATGFVGLFGAFGSLNNVVNTNSVALARNTDWMAANGLETTKLTVTKQGATTAMTGFAGSLSKTQVALTALTVALPFIIAAIGQASTSVAEARQEFEQLDSEFGKIVRARLGLKKLSDEFEKTSKKIRSSSLSNQAALELLKGTVEEYGQTFIDVNDIALTSSDQLIGRFDEIEKSISRQIDLQRELNGVREEQARADRIEKASGLFEATFVNPRNLLGGVREGSIDLQAVVKQRAAIEKLQDILNRTDSQKAREALRAFLTDGITKAGPAREALAGQDELGRALRDIAPVLVTLANDRKDLIRQLIRDTDPGRQIAGLINALSVKTSLNTKTAVGQLTQIFDDLEKTTDQRREEVLDLLFPDAGDIANATKEQKEAVDSIVDFYLNAQRDAVTKLGTGSVNPFNQIQAQFRDSIGGLEADINDVTFQKWIDELERARTGAEDVRVQIERTFKQAQGELYPRFFPDLGVQLPADALTSVVGDRLRKLPPSALDGIAEALGVSLRTATEDTLDRVKEAFETKGSIKISTDPAAIAREVEKVRSNIENALVKDVLGQLAQSGALDELGNLVTDEFGQVNVNAERLLTVLKGVSAELGDRGVDLQQLINELIALSQTNLFERSVRAIAALEVQTLVDQSDTKLLQNELQIIESEQRRLLKVEQAITDQRGISLSYAEDTAALEERGAELAAEAARLLTGGAAATEDAALAEGVRKEELLATTLSLKEQDEQYKKLSEGIKAVLALFVQQVTKDRERAEFVDREIRRRRTLQLQGRITLEQRKEAFSVSRGQLKILRDQLSSKRRELELNGQLTGTEGDQRKARNDLLQIQLSINAERQKGLLLFIDQNRQRDELIARAQQLLDRDNKSAGLQFRIQGLKRQILGLDIESAKLGQRRIRNIDDQIALAGDILENDQRRIEVIEEALDLEEELDEKLKDQNDTLSLRLGILRDIISLSQGEQAKVTEDLTRALKIQFNTSPIETAQAAARELGLTVNGFNRAFTQFDKLLPRLVEGIKDGTISANAFGQTVGGIGEDVRAIQTQLNPFIDNLRRLQDDREAGFLSDFRRALNSDDIDKAQKALSSLRNLAGQRLGEDEETRLRRLLELEKLAQELDQANREERERLLKLKLELDLSQFDQFKEELKALEQREIKIGLVADELQQQALISGKFEKLLVGNNDLLVEIRDDLRKKADRQGFRSGGRIPGFGGGDIVPAMLEPGEFVIPKEAVSRFGNGMFESLRRGQIPGFQDGGLVLPLGHIKSELETLASISPTFNELIFKQLGDDDFTSTSIRTFGTLKLAEEYLKGAGAAYNPTRNEIVVKPDLFKALGDGGSGATDSQYESLAHELMHVVQQKRVLDLSRVSDTYANEELLSDKARVARNDIARAAESYDAINFAMWYINREKEAAFAQKALLTELNYSRDIGLVDAGIAEHLRPTVAKLVEDGFDPGAERDASGNNAFYYYLERGLNAYNTLIGALNNPDFADLTSGIQVRNFNTGGSVTGSGSGDIIPAMLEPGEFVIPKNVVSRFGSEYFERLRAGQVPGFTTGGLVREASRFGLPALDSVLPADMKGDRKETLDLLDRIASSGESVLDLTKKSVSDARNAGTGQSSIPALTKIVAAAQAEAAQASTDLASKFRTIDEEQAAAEALDPRVDFDAFAKKAKDTFDQLGTDFAKELVTATSNGDLLGALQAVTNEALPASFKAAGAAAALLADTFGEDVRKRLGDAVDRFKDRFASVGVALSVQGNKALKTVFAPAGPAFKLLKEGVITAFEEGVAVAFSALTSIIDVGSAFDAIAEGGAAIAAATVQYEESLLQIEKTFEEAFGSAEQSLSRNESDFLSFIDTIQDAELARYAQRVEAERQLQAEIEETNKIFLDFAKEGASNVFSGLQTQFDEGAKNAFKREVTTVDDEGNETTTEVNSVATLFTSLQQGFKDNSNLGTALSDVIKDSAKLAFASLGSFMIDIVQSGLSFIADPTAIKETIGGLNSFVDKIINDAPKIVDEVVGAFLGFIDSLVEKLPAIVDSLVEALPRLLSGLVEGLKRLLPPLIQALADALPDLIRALVPLLGDLIIVLLDNVPALIEAILEAVPILVIEIIKQLPRIVLKVIETIVKSVFVIVVSIFKAAGKILIDIVTLGFRGLFKGLGTLFEDIKLFFKKLTPEQRADRDEARRTSTLGGSAGNLQGGIAGFNINRKRLRRKARKAANQKRKTGSQNTFTLAEVEELKAIFPKDSKIQTLREGGFLEGFGGGDIVPALLEPGEFVMPKEVVRALGPDFFEGLRQRRDRPNSFDVVQRFQSGGIVRPSRGLNSGVGSLTAMNQVNNISLTVDGATTEEQKRRTAEDLVRYIDEGLENRRRNRSLKLGQ